MNTRLNIGTFDKHHARELVRILRGASKQHKRERITDIKLRGRGVRAIPGYSTDRLRQDLPPKLAPKLAVYLSVEIELATENYLREELRKKDEELNRLREVMYHLKAGINGLMGGA